MANHSAEAALFTRRVLVIFLLISIAISALISNMYFLQVTSYKKYKTRSNENRIKVEPIPPTRGLIYDTNGIILAENKSVYSLKVVVKKASNLKNELKALTKLLSLTDLELNTFKKNNYRSKSFKSITIRTALSQKDVAVFTANRHHFKGFSIQADLQRYYRFGDTFTHVLGYVSKMNAKDKQRIEKNGEQRRYRGTNYIGKRGIEKYYESLLHGEPGQQQVEVNSWGKVIRTLSYTPPTPGKDIKLNIDLRLQLKAQQLLRNQRGSIVVINVNTGAVLTLLSNPSYDPNLFVQGMTIKQYDKLLQSRDRPLLNRATQGRYAPASTIKPEMALLALNTGVITEHTTINDPGWWIVPGSKRRFRDWKQWGHGTHVDVFQAIKQSCDTFFYKAAYQIGIDRINPFMEKFGFGKYSGIDLNEESYSIMPSRDWKNARFKKPWYDGDTVSIGIGQGYWTVTPIQLTKATAALATHGKVVKPTILQSVLSRNGSLPLPPEDYPSIILKNKNYWNIVLKGMYAVVSSPTGTGFRAFRTAYYTVAGKSGTAQVVAIKEGQHFTKYKVLLHRKDNALFVAFAPYENPEIAVTVILENAGGGSSKAAPMVRKILDEYFNNKNKKTSFH
ncbi:MAG: penicillin-binding protein 2 [Psychromonas sp.]|nr:penicillin-binding protein 2 [Psychromonas sp.]